MAVHFKFRSSVESDSINIDGDSISIADLKEKIARHKNLGKNTNFDLVITNAHTGEEYTDDHDQVPKNTSVLIKRVPASRPKSSLLVNGRVTFDVSDQASTSQSCADNVLGSTLFSDADSDDINNYGVGLYSVPGLVPEWSSAIFGTEENNEIVDMAIKTSLDHQRQAKEPCSSGEGSVRDYNGRDRERGKDSAITIPPAGYICHCCGQKGHFIQHCPQNSDLANDVKKANLPKTKSNDNQGATIQPDGSIGILQSDENVVSKEHSFRRPASTDSPPELQCPICQAIFKDAVMIPCCNYSFCDKCIRRDLAAKGQCPQCESSKFKDKDLLPNIALRLAIDRFFELSTQPPMDITDDGATNTQPVPGIADAGSATRANKASPGTSSLKVALDENKPVPSFKLMDPVIIAESVCESAVESKEKCISDHRRKMSSSAAAAAVVVSVEGLTSKEKFPSPEKLGLPKASVGGVFSRISQPLVTREEGVPSETEVMQGKKRKKPIRPLLTDGIQEQKATVKPRKGDRYCYTCGSPDHLARDCMETNEFYPSHRGAFHPGCSVRPNIMPAYPPQMYWHGPTVPPMRPYPLSYGDGIYGHMPLPFDASSMMPINAFGNPFMHPMYRGPPFHGGGVIGSVATGMVVPAQRPLSREEFMELQDWERRRRLMIEERENEESSSSGSELKPSSQQQLSVGERQSRSDNREVGIEYSDEDTDNGRSKNNCKYTRDTENRWKTVSDDEDDEQKSHEVGSSDMKRGIRHGQHQLSITGLNSYIEKRENSFSAHSCERNSKENSTRSSTEKCLPRNRKYEYGSSKKPESEYNHHREKIYVYEDKYGSQSSRKQVYEDKHGCQRSRRQISEDKHGSQSARRRVSEDKHRSQSSRRKTAEDNHGSRSSSGQLLEAVTKHDARYSKFDFSESDCHGLSRKNPTSQGQRHSVEAELKKRKRSHRKHRDDHLERKDSRYDLEEGLRVEKRRQGRHRISDDALECSEPSQERQNPGPLSQAIASSLDESLGESRWQMDSELDNAENTYFHSLCDYGRGTDYS